MTLGIVYTNLDTVQIKALKEGNFMHSKEK